MIYGLGELVRSFGAPVVSVARKHVERGEVDVMQTGPGARRLFGIVRPSNQKMMRVTARADARSDGKIELSGDCSCRTGRSCGHVAAVLLSALGTEALAAEAWGAGKGRAALTAARPGTNRGYDDFRGSCWMCASNSSNSAKPSR